jgi:hypothetical protein
MGKKEPLKNKGFVQLKNKNQKEKYSVYKLDSNSL